MKMMTGTRVSTVAALMILAAWTLNGQGPASPLAPGLPVTYERLLNADREPGNWAVRSCHSSIRMKCVPPE